MLEWLALRGSSIRNLSICLWQDRVEGLSLTGTWMNLPRIGPMLLCTPFLQSLEIRLNECQHLRDILKPLERLPHLSRLHLRLRGPPPEAHLANTDLRPLTTLTTLTFLQLNCMPYHGDY